MRCDIFGASEYYGGFSPCNSLVIAADGGVETLRKLGIKADILIGDYDSSSEPSDDHIKLPCVKDDTDTLAAIKLGIHNGCDEFHIWGGTGGKRSDHTLANLQCLIMLSKMGKKAYIHDKDITITAVTDGSLSFDCAHKGYISVFSADTFCKGVTISGLKYTLDNGELTNSMPLGVSNEFIGQESFISVKNGTLLVYYER